MLFYRYTFCQSQVLTIKGTRGDRMVLGIPNNNVRKQYYDYLKEMFEEKTPIDTSKLDEHCV